MNRADKLRPSKAATWMVCAGYAAMAAAYPALPEEADNEVREDGIACHWLAGEIWEKRYPKVDSISPNGRLLTEAMFDHVDEYHDILNSWPGVAPVCEKQVPCDVILKGMKGTPDAWAYDPTNRILYVADLKYGFRFVEVWENWQLIIYAAALIELLGLNGLDDQYLTIKFYIYQPRSHHRDGPVRIWTVRGSELRGFVNQLRHAAEEAMKPNPICTPNPHCTDCEGRMGCTALQNSALVAMEQGYSGVPVDLPLAALGDELRRLVHASKLLEARISGLQVQAESELRRGKVVPHWSLSPTYAREAWKPGTESQVMTLGTLYNANLIREPKPISPAQARKLIPVEMVAMFAHKPSTGVALTKQDPFEARKKFTTKE